MPIGYLFIMHICKTCWEYSNKRYFFTYSSVVLEREQCHQHAKMLRITFLLSILLVVTFADEFLDCKCKDGYSAQMDTSGNVYCKGNVVKSAKSFLPCNIVFKPDCVCGNEATSVVQDSSGTWCGRFVEGIEDRRWECENTEEWAAFYEEHPEEKPKSQ